MMAERKVDMTTELKIDGMTCGHCEKAVQQALAGVAGVERVEVDLAGGLARVEGEADLAALVAAVEEEGFQAGAAGR
jgi:copper chaperone